MTDSACNEESVKLRRACQNCKGFPCTNLKPRQKGLKSGAKFSEETVASVGIKRIC